MRHAILALVGLTTAACAVPAMAPATPPPGGASPAAAASTAPTPRLGSAVVTVAGAAYALKQADGAAVHRWVPADVLVWQVKLARETAPEVFDLSTARQALLFAKGPGATSRATFQAVAFGFRYRAYVTAFGNPGGVVAEGGVLASERLPMTTVPGTVDFDFSGDDLPTAVTKPVQVVFDAVPFAGTGTIHFAEPETAPFVNPDGAITAEARP